MSNLIIPEYHHNYWFYRSPEGDNSWIVTEMKTGQFLAYYPALAGINSNEVGDIERAFTDYKGRPEYFMYNNIYNLELPDVVGPTDLDILSDMYNRLLIGGILNKYVTMYHDANIGIRRAQPILEWLEANKFYESPGSTKFHDSYKGGLLLHSLRVLKLMVGLKALPYFEYEPIESCVITALTHDWCKIGLYHTYSKNVKNESTGQWEKQEAYRREITGIPLGHGELSLYYLMKFVPVTDAEALAIRWHMSHWYASSVIEDDLQTADENYPLVHMLQFADQLSITEYAN